MARTSPSRVNLKGITDNLRVASRKGDRAALTLALDQMKTLALSPRYWEKYLGLLRNPLARLVDMLETENAARARRHAARATAAVAVRLTGRGRGRILPPGGMRA